MEEKKEKQLNSVVDEELDLQFLHDINLRLTGEVGRTKKNFIDILKLKEGDIIKLDKNTEDYIEIYLRGQLFAIGELVVVNEKYAVRVVDLA
ncbi:FliM/FliN family flagellar motor switch protein [Persephonella sp.]|uniref:FliM/FliN family flagellar motor switch protein n=1 Tax=Persephonella sp. TaxID=2060922 RepID=UPI0025F83AE8|nr:FliM/FliN family flagellar motor switch protein [Persephonella sp.]